MGLISKQINKARTSKHLVPTTAVTTLDEQVVFAVAQAVVSAYVPKREPNQKWGLRGDARLWLEPSSDPHSRLVVCQCPLLKEPDRHGDPKTAPWVLQLKLAEQPPRKVLQLLFLRGRTKDGLLQELKLYTQFRDHFLATMQGKDPGFRLLEPAQ